MAYYIDGVLVPNDKFIGFSFYDIDAIEVLRGPQGTLTGQNSTGGAIFIRTPKPEFDYIGGYGEITAASYHQFKGAGAINLGGQNVAFRLAGIHDQRDSFTDNIAPLPLSQPGRYNLDSVRGTLALKGLDGRLNITARGEYFDNDSDGNPVKNRFDAVTSDPFKIEEDAISFTNQDGYRLAGDARFDVSDSVQLRGILSWQ
ncbi:MAG: TonB-dependent receptor, partial [Planctomycetes bacterium]|nr:TonB-dependent receptor [Planctomycetota bacterium]